MNQAADYSLITNQSWDNETLGKCTVETWVREEPWKGWDDVYLERGLCVNAWHPPEGFAPCTACCADWTLLFPCLYPNVCYDFYTADAQLLFDGQILSERRLQAFIAGH